MTMINLGADFASAAKAEAVVGSDHRERASGRSGCRCPHPSLDLERGAAGDVADAEVDWCQRPGRLGRGELVCEELVDATDEFGTQTVAVVRSEPAADKRKGSISALFYRL